MGLEPRGTGTDNPLQDVTSEHFISPNASRAMGQNPRVLG